MKLDSLKNNEKPPSFTSKKKTPPKGVFLFAGGDGENRSRVAKYISSLRSKFTKRSRPRLTLPAGTCSGLQFQTKAKQFAFSTPYEYKKNPARGGAFLYWWRWRESHSRPKRVSRMSLQSIVRLKMFKWHEYKANQIACYRALNFHERGERSLSLS